MDTETENFLVKLKKKMQLKFSKKEEKKEEEKNMDLYKSLDKMNIDEELSINELNKEPQNINTNKNSLSTNKRDELWRVGIVCKKECFALTTEILQIL